MRWLERLKQGLSKSANRLGGGITNLMTGKTKLDQEILDGLEELLISADIGPALAIELCEDLAKTRFDKDITSDEIKAHFANKISEILAPVVANFPAINESPTIILVVGVNGSGKTTTIGKLAQYYKSLNKKILLVAGDRFGAAAQEQLTIWGERNQADVLNPPDNRDAAALAFDAMVKAKDGNYDLVLMDTAGRLQNRQDLMEELAKIHRVMAKKLPNAPHHVLLVLDATVGQNALSQLAAFLEMTKVTGLILTKLDGTAKGGVLVALAHKHQIPVHAIGVGEGIEDLRPFDAKSFANSIIGIENQD